MTLIADELFALENLGEADLSVIIAIQLADIDEVLRLQSRKGKAKEGDPISSAECALEYYRNYLSATATLIADSKLAHSIDQALGEDAQILETILFEEQVALRDREMAIRLSDSDTEEPVEPHPADIIPPDAGNHVPGSDPGLPLGYATSSGNSSGASMSGLVRETDCCSCLERHYCVTAPCGDTYCHKCIKQVFLNATRDEELFPPRCHRKEIPLFLAQPFLARDDIAAFKLKRIEFTTRNRTYCYNSKCLAFIAKANIEDDCALCTSCALMTCVSCKQKWHGKTDCPTDTALNATLELAVTHGWQRCSNCHALVERSHGCQHIICKCKYEFCYRCSLKWKTCECSDWDTRALDRRVEELAIRDIGNQAVPTRLARKTKVLRQELELRHECTHDGEWTRRDVPMLDCEMCYETLKDFLWVCVECKLMACTRCQRNRV